MNKTLTTAMFLLVILSSCYSDTTFTIQYDMAPASCQPFDPPAVQTPQSSSTKYQISSVNLMTSFSDFMFPRVFACNYLGATTLQPPGTITISDQCLPRSKQATHNCASWFRADLSKSTNIINLSAGKWKFRINGTDSSKSFLNIYDENNLVYWIDSMELYLQIGNNTKFLGIIYGHELPKMLPIAFEREVNIEQSGQLQYLLLKYSRKCNRAGNILLENAIPFTDTDLSIYVLDSIELEKL